MLKKYLLIISIISFSVAFASSYSLVINIQDDPFFIVGF